MEEVFIVLVTPNYCNLSMHSQRSRDISVGRSDGLSSIYPLEIFKQLTLMGYYTTDTEKVTLFKGCFFFHLNGWFLIHIYSSVPIPKKTAWEQFSSNIATAVICLATNRKYNFSMKNFEQMRSPIS
ncbi:hypothetical protein Tco_0070938 [Tanacetum coccineum]